ncbi:MAG: 50S ribosomal protein L29 [Desulfobacteraceae bacterium]|jgi:large subunit ribosomal protein L29|nr:50S ribosomal protein L29 [Desulfobacteraceae bacterium]
MKGSEVRELSPEERVKKIDELKQELFNLRFQNEIGQLENPRRIQQVKRDVARIQTVIREEELGNPT